MVNVLPLGVQLEKRDITRWVLGSRVAHALLGDGMDFKSRAFKTIMERVAA